MKKIIFPIATLFFSFSSVSFAENSPFSVQEENSNFKRLSISIGWAHGISTGKTSPITMSSSAHSSHYKNGTLATNAVQPLIANTTDGAAAQRRYSTLLSEMTNWSGRHYPDTTQPPRRRPLVNTSTLTPAISGITQIDSLESWSNENASFKSENFDSVALALNYNISENISASFKLNSPARLNMQGTGELFTPMRGFILLEGKHRSTYINNAVNSVRAMPIDRNLPIVDLSGSDSSASIRSWLPSAEIQYQFGKPGIDKFRPYIGAGIMFAIFSNASLDKKIEQGLIRQGHFIQNLKTQDLGTALTNSSSSAEPVVSIQTKNKIAPVLTLGATYDLNENWFAVASLSYAKMHTKADIITRDKKTNTQLTKASTKINIDPLMTYIGVGYRF